MRRPSRALLYLLLLQTVAACSTYHGLHVSPGYNRVVVDYSDTYGWSEEEICDALRYHIIEVGSDGAYRPLQTNLECRSDEVRRSDAAVRSDDVNHPADDYSQPQDFRDHIDNIRQHISASDREVVFVFHGGLVSLHEGLQESIILKRAMLRDAVRSGGGSYPIFINWRSGGVDAYIEQVLTVRKGQRMPRVAGISGPVKIVSDIGRGIADMPSMGVLEGQRLWESQFKRNDACDADGITYAQLICPESISRGWGREAMEYVQYFVETPARIVTSPIINGPGKSAWENMVRRTRQMFWQEPGEAGAIRRGAIRELFDELFIDEKQRKDSTTVSSQFACNTGGRSISLIGHSMGTMIISDLLHAYPQCPYKDVVYMAAAVSVREFEQTVMPALALGRNIHFYNLTLLPKSEAREMSMFGLVPSGTLLEWIDEMYTPPTTKFDLTLGKWDNVRLHFPVVPGGMRDKVSIRVFGRAQGEPRHHGDFNDVEMCFWRRGFWTSPWQEHQAQCRAFLEDIQITKD